MKTGSWRFENIARLNLKAKKVIFSLRPLDLDDLGLVPAVKILNEFNKEQFNCRISFFWEGTKIQIGY